VLEVRNGTVTCTSGGYGLLDVSGILVVGDLMTFGACPLGAQLWADSPLSRVAAVFNYNITGGAAYHAVAANGGHMDLDGGVTVTLTGTPAYSSYFAYAFSNGLVISNNTYTGAATGIRYNATTHGTIQTGGGGPNTFPGSIAGGVSFGATYDSPGTPTVVGASCGTGPGAVTGTDINGHVTEGTTATGCTLNFTTSNTPFACIVQTNSPTANASLAIAVSATQLFVTHPSVSSATLYWSCPPEGG